VEAVTEAAVVMPWAAAVVAVLSVVAVAVLLAGEATVAGR
jgi:hypothetical protein